VGEVSNKLVAYDPGLRWAGVAVFDDGRLTGGAVVWVDEGEGAGQWQAMGDKLAQWASQARTVAVEVMRYRASNVAAVERVLGLAYTTGCLLGALFPEVAGGPHVHLVDPHVWTGGLKKDANAQRIQRALGADEQAVLTELLAAAPKAHHKELIDAVGIGLFAMRRL